MRTARAISHPQWRQVAIYTALAIGVYAGFRNLPTGTNLSHLDFRPGGSSVEMCDPSNPQFIPVVAVKSPVTMELSRKEAALGRDTEFRLTLTSASGRPVGPEDLAVVHTRKLHLLLIDPSLEDYQHIHPEPGAVAGEWIYRFTPRRAGTYRVFADFTPIATGRGLYGFAEIHVDASPGQAEPVITYPKDEYDFVLKLNRPARVRQQVEWTLEVVSRKGGAVPLTPVMGAFAHLVAFDDKRLGFAHLHPKEAEPGWRPDANRPAMHFSVTFPQVGNYVLWAQMALDGREVFVPIRFEVGA